MATLAQQMVKLTVPQEIATLKNQILVLNYRIRRQQKLLKKIKRGKCMFTSLEQQPLYALANHDLKILQKMRTELHKQLPKLEHILLNETVDAIDA